MASPAERQAAHDAAGAAYVAAAEALVAAYFEVCAFDIAAADMNTGVVTFPTRPHIVGHPTYLHGDALAYLNLVRSAELRARIGQLISET